MRALMWTAIVCGCLVGELAAAQPTMVAPVRVGGNIRPPVKIRDVRPVYPDDALNARVAGIVIVEVAIGTDGIPTEARVLRGVPMLNAAALEAVKQWQWEPTLLGSTAVPVIMTVTVNFVLPDQGAGRAARLEGVSGTTGIGSPLGPPPAGIADDPFPSESARAAASATPFLVTSERVGVVWIAMSIQALTHAVPPTQIKPIPRRTMRGVTADLAIALEPDGPTALVANIHDNHVIQIEVRSNRFRTEEGFGIGTSLGELRRYDPGLRVVMCDRGPCALMSSRLYTFELDASAATAAELSRVPDQALVTGVLIVGPVKQVPPPAPPPPSRRE